MPAAKDSLREKCRRDCHWWWLDVESAAKTFPAFGAHWKSLHRRELIRGAWFYELEKRVTGKYRFRKPYCALSLPQLEKVRRLWPMDRERQKFAALAGSKLGQGWSDVVSLNLYLNDRALFLALKKWLAVERGKLGIVLRKTATKGERRQRYSWLMVEVFDLAQHRQLNDSERKLKSQAAETFRKWQED